MCLLESSQWGRKGVKGISTEFFLLIITNLMHMLCVRYLLELPLCGNSNEYLQHMSVANYGKIIPQISFLDMPYPGLCRPDTWWTYLFLQPLILTYSQCRQFQDSKFSQVSTSIYDTGVWNIFFFFTCNLFMQSSKNKMHMKIKF